MAIALGPMLWVGQFNTQDRLIKLWDHHIVDGVTPSGVHFVEGGNTVLLALLENHTLIKYRTMDGVECSRGTLNNRIMHVPMQVCFLGDSGIIASGSDRGLVWTWDINSNTKKKLRHTHFLTSLFRRNDLVQILQYHQGNSLNYFASASSANGRNITINIWDIYTIFEFSKANTGFQETSSRFQWRDVFIVDTLFLWRLSTIIAVFTLFLVVAVLPFLRIVPHKDGYYFVYLPLFFVIEGTL
ncbi:hypothetical protein M422DRAFT_44564 [Sphaerobolus stellatus SS14]|nr:hypothetical protein M422DRAFT_44564 [Sphaerobolus stellatus SS14]